MPSLQGEKQEWNGFTAIFCQEISTIVIYANAVYLFVLVEMFLDFQRKKMEIKGKLHKTASIRKDAYGKRSI